jgi:hypothetical protein
MHSPIPVICDLCRAHGTAGEADFSHLGGLLDFEPVPRKVERADGWTPDIQRAFILALATTGSVRQAAAAVGRAAYGAERLRKAEGGETFAAAWDRALAAFEETKAHRLSAGLSAVAAESASWSPKPAPWSRARSRARPPSHPPAPEPSPERALSERREFVREIGRKYLLKIRQERRCRLDGRIVEADFYLRQITWLEVVLDCTSEDAWTFLSELRVEGRHLIQIAQTPMARLLQAARRRFWASCGDPPRPEHLRPDLLQDHGRFSTEPGETLSAAHPLSHQDQIRLYEERHARDAEEQVEWEAQARRDYEERRERDASS